MVPSFRPFVTRSGDSVLKFKHICGVHWNRSKPFTKTNGTVKFYQDLYYCKHKSFSPKLDILILHTNCSRWFDSSFENLVLHQDNMSSWWFSNILLLWGEVICSSLLGLPQSTFPKTSPTCLLWKNGFHIIAEKPRIFATVYKLNSWCLVCLYLLSIQ